MVPLSRWSTYDRLIDDSTPCVSVRYRLHKYGDIIPVLYCVENHHRVIFRLGERLINLQTAKDDIYEEELEYDGENGQLLGALPITYSQFLASGPEHILDILDDAEVQRNLWGFWMDRNLRFQFSSSIIIFESLQLLEQEGERPDERNLEKWSDEKWRVVYCKIENDLRASTYR